MRKLFLMMLFLLLLPLFAQAAGLTLTPTDEGFAYDFTLEDEWVRLHYKGPTEKGVKTLYAPGGHFTGGIDLRSEAGGQSYYAVVKPDVNVGMLSQIFIIKDFEVIE